MGAHILVSARMHTHACIHSLRVELPKQGLLYNQDTISRVIELHVIKHKLSGHLYVCLGHIMSDHPKLRNLTDSILSLTSIKYACEYGFYPELQGGLS